MRLLLICCYSPVLVRTVHVKLLVLLYSLQKRPGRYGWCSTRRVAARASRTLVESTTWASGAPSTTRTSAKQTRRSSRWARCSFGSRFPFSPTSSRSSSPSFALPLTACAYTITSLVSHSLRAIGITSRVRAHCRLLEVRACRG